MFVLRKRLDKGDKAHKGSAVTFKVLAIVKIIVAKNPEGLADVCGRPNKTKGCSWIDDNLVPGEEVMIEARKFRRDAILVSDDRAVVVTDDIGRVIINPARLHEAQNEALVN